MERIEQAVLRGDKLKNLNPPDTMPYSMYELMYGAFKTAPTARTKDEWKALKSKINTAYKEYSDNYFQFIGICAEYQRRIREGYQIKGVKIIEGEIMQTVSEGDAESGNR